MTIQLFDFFLGLFKHLPFQIGFLTTQLSAHTNHLHLESSLELSSVVLLKFLYCLTHVAVKINDNNKKFPLNYFSIFHLFRKWTKIISERRNSLEGGILNVSGWLIRRFSLQFFLFFRMREKIYSVGEIPMEFLNMYKKSGRKMQNWWLRKKSDLLTITNV